MTTLTQAKRIPFTASQKRLLGTLASAVGLRMLGLFLVLPVFTLYGLQFTSSRFLVGFAFGCYGLAMAMSEMPLGRSSDRVGRRKILLLGMSVFSLGSFLCAIPSWFPRPWQICELIVGRLVQGIGAVTSTAFATVADHVQPERRSTAMAVLGIPIGASFAIGVIGGPIIAGLFKTESLFWLTGALGVGTVLLLKRYLPESAPSSEKPAPLARVLRGPGMLALDLSGFLMNTFMTSFWFYFPLIATGQHHLKLTQYYLILLPMLVASGVTMFGFSQGADRGWGKPLAMLGFVFLVASGLTLFRPALAGLNPDRLTAVLVPGTLFLIGFTGLEPVLPSLVSKAAPEGTYGTALGFFQTLTYLGSFAGGSMAGGLSHFPSTYIMTALVVVSFAGFLLMLLKKL